MPDPLPDIRVQQVPDGVIQVFPDFIADAPKGALRILPSCLQYIIIYPGGRI
jgi:hypothetical protein